MELKLLNIFAHIISVYKGITQYPKYVVWAFRNKNKEASAHRLNSRVRNDLGKYGVQLPLGFEVSYWTDSSYYSDHIITFCLADLNPKFRYRCSALDILRHEYGHAFFDFYYSLSETKGRGWKMGEWRKLFGDPEEPYDSWRFLGWKHRHLDQNCYISKYAQVHPEEDFAETFAEFLKVKGDISKYKKRPVLFKKLQLVEQMLHKYESFRKGK